MHKRNIATRAERLCYRSSPEDQDRELVGQADSDAAIIKLDATQSYETPGTILAHTSLQMYSVTKQESQREFE